MSTKGKIESGKILVKAVFDTKWFNIPVYQRPYVWKSEHISELLEDLTFAMTENSENSDFEYFLGSFVFQSRTPGSEIGQKYLVNDLLDGQQRMATLLMLFAVIRDLVNDVETKDVCQNCIFQKAIPLKNIPAQTRIAYVTHSEVTTFISDYITAIDGTIKGDKLKREGRNSDDPSVKNMATAVIVMHKFFSDNTNKDLPTKLLKFLLNNVLFIYVSTEDLEDAFRLFRVSK